ncbi:MAG: 4Fe-4S binding protein [Acidobacteriota bacterium]|nr:4Fe-4S binding protein [Acidobacteriota bacterium]MDH3784334.1 4Fe-4S binding protein [Acidobacteriota bacterium]
MSNRPKRPDVTLVPQLCKGCGRCIESCPKDAISFGTDIEQASGFVPVSIDYDVCNHCGLCVTACPEPFGISTEQYELEDPEHLFGPRKAERRHATTIEPTRVPLPEVGPLVLKGNYACAVGALLAGCRHVYGYPITPSTEGAELMARLLPQLEGTFVQAISEVATINHLYGCGGAGLPTMTFTSSPGFSLMLEGISYMIGSQVPGVILNVMRPGPGLGFIGPEQSDIKLVCRGLGHGNTHAIVLAPSSPQEMLDYTVEAFALSFKYRNPVIIAADGYLGQITGRVNLPDHMIEPGLPDWAVWGDADHRDNLIASIFQDWAELEAHNEMLSAKYRDMQRDEQRANLFRTDDASILVVAANTPARTAKAAVEQLRGEGIPVGLFQPITLWPFPIDTLSPLLEHAKQVVVVEASDGQLEDELRLALSHNDTHGIEFHHVRHMGGILPEGHEVVETVRNVMGVCQ